MTEPRITNDTTGDPEEANPPRPLHEPDEVPVDPQKEREREKD